MFYASCWKIWDHHFDSRLTKLVNIFITDRVDLNQDVVLFIFFSILPTLLHAEDNLYFPRNSSMSKFLLESNLEPNFYFIRIK